MSKAGRHKRRQTEAEAKKRLQVLKDDAIAQYHCITRLMIVLYKTRVIDREIVARANSYMKAKLLNIK